MGGKLTFPGGSAYHATKYAVESMSDALRFEVEKFGVDVVVVEPGLIRSGFADAVAKAIETAIGAKTPKPRYRVTVSASLLMTQRAWMSDCIWDLFLRGSFPQPGPTAK